MIIKRVKVTPPPPPPDLIHLEMSVDEATSLKGLLGRVRAEPHEQQFINTLMDNLDINIFPR